MQLACNYALRMSSTLAANIRQLRSRLGLNQADFADRVGGKQPNVSKWEAGTFAPSGDSLAAMAELAGCTFEQFKNVPLPSSRPVPEAGHRGDRPEQPPVRSSDAGETVDILQLDLSVAMGAGTLIEDFVESELVSFDAAALGRITRTPASKLRFVTGIGTSHEPKFQSYDQFLIDINERELTRLDGYYWITFDGAHALKRLRPAGNGMVEIISENPEFKPMTLARGEVRIEGRAIWFARRL